MAQRLFRRETRVLWLTAFAGLLFVLIGVRFLLWPDSAAATFGLAPGLRFELHHVIGLRDVWLALLALALAWLREWRALGLWFAFGALVCFADSFIVLRSSANPYAIGFHLASGVFCIVLARACWLLTRTPREKIASEPPSKA